MSVVCKIPFARQLFQTSIKQCRAVNRVQRANYNKFHDFFTSSTRTSILTLGATSCLGGAVAILWYGYPYDPDARGIELYNTMKVVPVKVQPTLPEVRISRSIINPADTSDLKLVLFQYPTCPFCCKVRAFLDFNGLSYDVVEVDPVLRYETRWTDYRKVPIILAKVDDGYQQLNDSSMIVSILQSYLLDGNKNLKDFVTSYPTVKYKDNEGKIINEILNKYHLMFNKGLPKEISVEDIESEKKWRKWVDEVFVHVLSPNVYRSMSEAYQSFSWFSEVGEWERLFPMWERFIIIYVGAIAMYFVSKKLKKKYSLKEDVRQSLYDECHHWMKAVKSKGTTFFGGNSPNLADLAVYGALSSIEGCIAFRDLLENTDIGNWYKPMKEIIESRKGSLQIQH